MNGSNNHRITVGASALGYWVDEEGRVVSPTGAVRVVSFRPKNPGGSVLYGSVSVKIGGKHSSCKVHQLVAYQKFGDAAFADGVQVRHLNGDSTDNRPDNIGIGTPSENAFDKAPEVRKAMALKAASARRSLTRDRLLELIAMRNGGASLSVCGAAFGLSKGQVSEIMSGKLYSELSGIPFAARKTVAA